MRYNKSIITSCHLVLWWFLLHPEVTGMDLYFSIKIFLPFSRPRRKLRRGSRVWLKSPPLSRSFAHSEGGKKAALSYKTSYVSSSTTPGKKTHTQNSACFKCHATELLYIIGEKWYHVTLWIQGAWPQEQWAFSCSAGQWIRPDSHSAHFPTGLSKGLREGSDGDCALHSTSDPFPVWQARRRQHITSTGNARHLYRSLGTHFPQSPCWCGPGMKLDLWRHELKKQVQWRTWDSTSIHLPYFANTAFCKSHASKAFGSAFKFFWILKGGDVRAGQESKWKLMTEADINQLHSMFFPAGFFQ